MANEFYNRGATFNPDELADGDALEAEFDAVVRGFDTINTAIDTDRAGYPTQTFHVAPATEATHAPQKAQLDAHINDQGGAHGATSKATPDKLVKRDINGNIAARAFISETPAKGDSSTKCATTEFLGQQGLRFSSDYGSGVDANMTVPIERVGGWYEIHGAYIITLPTMSSVPVGATITFRNTSGTDAKIKAAATEQIAPAGSPSANEITIKSGEIITFVNNKTSWYVISCGFGSDSFTVSKVMNGYQKLPSGLIIQWVTGQTSSTGRFTGSWPIAFPAALLCEIPICTGGGATSTASAVAATSGSAASASVFDVWSASALSGQGAAVFAIGY